MKFEFIETYRQGHEQVAERLDGLRADRDKAHSLLQELKLQYETLLTRSVQTGKDKTVELDELSDKISAAQRDLDRKEMAYTVGTQNIAATIRPDDVIAAWNNEFMPKYKQEVVDPASAALLAAKKAYIDAYRNYRSVIKQYDAEKDNVVETLAPGRWPNPYQYKLLGVDFNLTSETDLYLIKPGDLYDLAEGLEITSLREVK